MRITRIEIENFRSIRHVVIDLSDTTVLVGPNNAGKTAILDALRIGLTRRWGQHGTGFSEYDIHLANENADPKASRGVRIELKAEEREAGEWPTNITEDLGDIIALDMTTGRNSVSLRTCCRWRAEIDSFEPSWEFLSSSREPMAGVGARRVNLEKFWRYLPFFYLGALRDVGDEFSARSSQFWTQLLKDMSIPPDLESRSLRILDLLNRRILNADPRFEKIANTLSGATRIAARDREGGLNLRMVPLKTWDLISRAEIILRNDPDVPWLPLRRQGQGIQSLSVIFLFQAFVEHLLGGLYNPDSKPVLALEEPETHLHPQATRTLWNHIEALPGQKLVTTHSPYFVQQVPFRDLRLVRLKPEGTEVRSLPTSFSTQLPVSDEQVSAVANSAETLNYDDVSKTLTVHGKLEEGLYRKLLRCCAKDGCPAELQKALTDLRDRSRLYMKDEELKALETQARRMRGEIFFAERWLIVEGQADYMLMHAVAYAQEYDLDRHGVSVIDAKNNGSPTTFVALARALDIPWLAVFDGDGEGKRYVQSILERGIEEAEVNKRCRTLPEGDLEAQLVADGLRPELTNALEVIGIRGNDELSDEELTKRLRRNKTAYAAELAARIRDSADMVNRMPVAFREAIEKLRGLT